MITNSQKAYLHLKNRLIAGDYVPGSRLLYGPIGKELGMSATPVREAIGQLCNEGFIDLVPQLGAVVREVTAQEMLELYELREAIEPFAASRAAARIEQNQLAVIRGCWETMQQIYEKAKSQHGKVISKKLIRQLEQADLAFHLHILEAVGNQLMIKTVGNSHILTRIFSAHRHLYDHSILKTTVDDHQRILLALERGQSEAAREAMAVHIRNSLELTLAATKQNKPRWWNYDS